MNISTIDQMMYDMKKESGFGIAEIENMYPFEMEIFHNMCIRDIKERINLKQQAARG
jgi:hypothetical protein